MSTKLLHVDCFPTPIWQFTVEGYEELNTELLSYIKQNQVDNTSGSNVSNILGWHSGYLDDDHEVLRKFSRIIISPLADIANRLKWDLKNNSLTVHECWAVVNKKYSSNLIHSHPNSFLSATYYVKTPRDCGNIFFVDPRETNHVYIPPYTEATAWNKQSIEIEPREGLLVIFPSWLKHGVRPNKSDEERVVMSFNVKLQPK